MTINELTAAAAAGKVSQEEPETESSGSSSTGSAAPAAPSDSMSIEQFIPILTQLQSPQAWLSAAPTFVPQSFQDMIQFVYDGSDYWIYFYANNQWNKAAASGGTAVTQIIAGTNVTVSPAGGTGAVTVSASPTGSSASYANGNFQYNFNNANGTVVVSHGLGKIPANMRVTALYAQGAPSQFLSMGTYNGTQNAVIFSWIQSGSGGTSGSATGFALWMRDNGGNGQTAVVTWDAFNITFTFTKWGTFGSVIFDVMWEANT